MTHEWVVAHTNESGSRHTYECVMAHIWWSWHWLDHDTHVNVCVYVCVWLDHDMTCQSLTDDHDTDLIMTHTYTHTLTWSSAPWHIHMGAMTHSYVCRDPDALVCATTHSHVPSVTDLIMTHTYTHTHTHIDLIIGAMTHSIVTRLVHIYAMTYSCVTWLISTWHDLCMCAMIHPCVPRLIHVCHDSCIRVPWLIRMCQAWLIWSWLIHVCKTLLFHVQHVSCCYMSHITYCSAYCSSHCSTHSNTRCDTHSNTRCDARCSTHCNTHRNTPCNTCAARHVTHEWVISNMHAWHTTPVKQDLARISEKWRTYIHITHSQAAKMNPGRRNPFFNLRVFIKE